METKKISQCVNINEDEKTSERNSLLQKIYWAAGRYEFENMENFIRKYQVEYGLLTGTERVWFRERYGDIYDHIYQWDRLELLFMATEFTKKYFFALVNGEEAAAKEYRHKAELQSSLKKAFEEKDLVTFDQLLAAGADINYTYYCPYGDLKITLWEEVRHTKGSMFEYFMTRTEIPEVKKLLEQKEAVADRKAAEA